MSSILPLTLLMGIVSLTTPLVLTKLGAANTELPDSIEIDGVTFALSGSGNWVSDTVPELEDATVYRALSPETSPNFSYMTAQIAGPAYIEYSARQRSQSNDLGGLYVDDISIHRYYWETRWRHYSHQIPDGIHKVEFKVDDRGFFAPGESPVQYADIRIVAGYELNVDHSGGILSVSPAKEAYQAGDAVSVSVVPIEGNQFAGWSGSDSSSEANIDLVISSHVNLKARFELVDLGFGQNLRVSNGVSAFWQQDITRDEEIALIAIPNEGVKQFTIEVDVDSPGTVSWDRVDQFDFYSSTDVQSFHVDGERWTTFSRYFARDNYSFSEKLGEGSHKLLWESKNTFSRGITANSIIMENLRFDPSVEDRGPYDNWAIEMGLGIGFNDEPDVDPNGDGIINIVHFAFGTNPIGKIVDKRNQQFAIASIHGENYLALTLPVHKSLIFSEDEKGQRTASLLGLEILIQATSDLSNFDLGAVNEIDPMLSEGMEILSSEYEYRTFITNDPVSSQKPVYFKSSARISL